MRKTRRAQIGWLVASAAVLVVAILAAGFSVTSCSGANGSTQDTCAPTTVDYVADAVVIALGILVAALFARRAWRVGRDSTPTQA